MKISVIIPVYKNIELFMGMMRNNWKYIKDEEVIVVDDRSLENLKEILNKEFKEITVLVNEKNIGFSKTVNKGIFHSHGEYIMLLNSDVKLIDNSYKNALSEFEKNNDLFALSFIQIERDGRLVGKNEIYFEKGFYYHRSVTDNKVGENGWAEGGSALFFADKLKQLKGFDEIFSPFYWEDIDLSYRAKRMGWKVLFYPAVKVEHHHESTIAKYHKSESVSVIALRNQFLFTWKNLECGKMLLDHVKYATYYFFINIIKLNFNYHKALFWAILIKLNIKSQISNIHIKN